MPTAKLMTYAVCLAMAGQLAAQPAQLGLNGMPGLLDMPTAQPPLADSLAGSFAYQDGAFATNFTYQLNDRLTFGARYIAFDQYLDPASAGVDGTFARGFDLHYRLFDETDLRPAVAIGLRDMLSPARFGGEYIVASKRLGPDLTVTAGLGWGALATRGGFDNPLGRSTRPLFDPSQPDGQFASDQWFAGDAALFGGLHYQITPKWGLIAEYSASAYPATALAPALANAQPYNLGLTYQMENGVELGLAALSGQSVALSGRFVINANDRPAMSGREAAPVPIKPRAPSAAPVVVGDLRPLVAALLQAEGFELTALEVSDDAMRLRYLNPRYRAQPQAMGRIARLLTQIAPPQIATFVLEPQARGLPLAAVTIIRADLERLENQPDAAALLLASSTLAAAGPDAGLLAVPPQAGRLQWGFGPYFGVNPSAGGVALDAGLRLRGAYQISPQLALSGTIRASLRNQGRSARVDTAPDIPNVRSDQRQYGVNGQPALQDLSLGYFGRVSDDIYSRVSIGYLEPMFGGVSAEALWKPYASPLALGAEVNWVAQRDRDMGFGFDDYGYDTVSGHLSAYYDWGNGYHSQLDVGRYLAGDWGAGLALDRVYGNGITVGAYVTRSEITPAAFGEGSYNKGVRISIPHDFFTGAASRDSYGVQVATTRGDGGARLAVDGRLYGVLRDAHQADLTKTWGRFWR